MTKEETKEYQIQYRIENKDKRKEYCKQYYNDNKEHIKEYYKQYYNDNKEHIKKYYNDNKEHIKKYQIQYRIDNHELRAANSAKYRALMKSQTPELTKEEQHKIKLLYEIRDLLNRDDIDFNVDHIRPLSQGGLHHPNNLQVLPVWLNFEKKNKWPLIPAEHIKYRGIRIKGE